MAREREDRTLEDWSEHGVLLLKMIDNRNNRHKEISRLISILKSDANRHQKEEATTNLNQLKYELGKNWTDWVKKINQKKNDMKRSRFYLKDKTFNELLSFLGQTKNNKKSDNEIFTALLSYISIFDLNSIDETYKITEELNRFSSATSERYSKSLLADKTLPQGRTNRIIKSILDELKKNKITSFEDLMLLRKITNKDMNNEIKFLNNENKSLKERNALLEKENNKLKLKQKTKLPINRQ
ncbi:hypothetical protein L1D32_09255 [Shewanella insulae]|uniref:hypothetical protein n=1 Tax=Shewanella insulae TaxID=2681496 RepID=UPI001EFC5A1F|nr:hypothetical protein [Shewanella insulae]MCG9738341.1 hypothetical protein [Shewanella insulae]